MKAVAFVEEARRLVVRLFMTMTRAQPIRTCVGCGAKKPPAQMLRVAASKSMAPVVDGARKSPGRGAHVCRELKCVERAWQKRAFERALKLNGAAPMALKNEMIQRLSV